MSLIVFLVIAFLALYLLLKNSAEKTDNSAIYYKENGRNINLTNYYADASQKGCKDSFCKHESGSDDGFYCEYYRKNVLVKDVCPNFKEHDLAGFMAAAFERQITGEELHFDDEE